ncbi:MAG: c-type cytochrome [Deltaproteobacteria bacterium]|nr:c-type cytochrome [Deltaproteobacteria bacterium]
MFLKQLIIILFLLALAGTAQILAQQKELLPDNPLQGRELFTTKKCIKCHAIQGVGGRIGTDLGKVNMDRNFLEMVSSLWNHFPRMNEAFKKEKLLWPSFTEKEMRDLITFLYTVNYFDQLGDPKIGEMLFQEKNCFFCHSVGGNGRGKNRSLDDYQYQISPAFITSQLWNNGPKMAKEMAKQRVPRPVFKDRDVIDILAFIKEKGLTSKTNRFYLQVGSPQKGEKIFKDKKCLHCHPVDSRKKSIGPELISKKLKGSQSYIMSKMWNHGSKMWKKMAEEKIKFPKITPEEMSNLTMFLYFLQFEDPLGSAATGKKLFQDKQCQICHFSNSEGQGIGPDLRRLNLNSSLSIVTAMWNHAPEMQEMFVGLNIRWPRFENQEMTDLMEYIISSQRK